MDLISTVPIDVYQLRDNKWVKLSTPIVVSGNIYRVQIDSTGIFAVTQKFTTTAMQIVTTTTTEKSNALLNEIKNALLSFSDNAHQFFERLSKYFMELKNATKM